MLELGDAACSEGVLECVDAIGDSDRVWEFIGAIEEFDCTCECVMGVLGMKFEWAVAFAGPLFALLLGFGLPSDTAAIRHLQTNTRGVWCSQGAVVDYAMVEVEDGCRSGH